MEIVTLFIENMQILRNVVFILFFPQKLHTLHSVAIDELDWRRKYEASTNKTDSTLPIT